MPHCDLLCKLQERGKIAEENNLYEQFISQTRSFGDISRKADDKRRAEDDANRALLEGAKKEPPLSASDVQSLMQACATARQDTERAEADSTNYLLQTLQPTQQALSANETETLPLKQQLSGLKQRRDTLMDGLNKSRTALAELNQEYQEPSL